MGKVQEITVWASGVVQDKEARDVAQCLASAAAKEGKFIQAFEKVPFIVSFATFSRRAHSLIFKALCRLADKNSTLPRGLFLLRTPAGWAASITSPQEAQ